MAMTELPINEENMAILSSILKHGFNIFDDREQPANIDQVITFLFEIADGEGYLKIETSDLLEKYKQKERDGESKC